MLRGAAQQVQPGHQRALALVQDGGEVLRPLGGGFTERLAGQGTQRRLLRAAVRAGAVHLL